MAARPTMSGRFTRLPNQPEQRLALISFEAKQKSHCPANEARLRLPSSACQLLERAVLVVGEGNLNTGHAGV
jgi:hypothetical protein